MNLQKRRLSILKSELRRRQEVNKKYSLRAFARDLEISHTLLSLVLSEKRELSNDFCLRLLQSAKLPLEESEQLKIGLPLDFTENFQKIDEEQFKYISDWVHYAILSLLEVKGSRWDPQWISRRLGQPQSKILSAMNRLESLGFVKISESGRARQCVGPITVGNERATAAAKKFNQELLKKATESMETCKFESRDLTSTIFTLSPKYLPYAVERIQNFRRSLTSELENLGEQEKVYALAVQLFPLEIEE